jgi:hypothetical protein
MKRRRNSSDLAAAAVLAQSWSGRAPSKVTEITEVHQYREDLADLAGLEELVVARGDTEYTLRFGHDVRLAGAPPDPGEDVTRQLYLIGGDQQLDLDSLDIGATERNRDKIDIGRVASICYYARKDHLDGKPAPYEHQFGEEGGELPLLVYDTRNRRLELVGGSYEIKLRDYDGAHSAGIRD